MHDAGIHALYTSQANTICSMSAYRAQCVIKHLRRWNCLLLNEVEEACASQLFLFAAVLNALKVRWLGLVI
jgi:hypothetical protein